MQMIFIQLRWHVYILLREQHAFVHLITVKNLHGNILGTRVTRFYSHSQRRKSVYVANLQM